MLVRLGQHIGFVTKPLVNFTRLSTRRFPTTLIALSVLYSWSSVTISRTFGFVVGGGLLVGDGDGPSGGDRSAPPRRHAKPHQVTRGRDERRRHVGVALHRPDDLHVCANDLGVDRSRIVRAEAQSERDHALRDSAGKPRSHHPFTESG